VHRGRAISGPSFWMHLRNAASREFLAPYFSDDHPEGNPCLMNCRRAATVHVMVPIPGTGRAAAALRHRRAEGTTCRAGGKSRNSLLRPDQPHAGSDAAGDSDFGIVCRGTWEGREWSPARHLGKRYITLAPFRPLLGLAFPAPRPGPSARRQGRHRITCALVRTDTPGVNIGRRTIL